MIDLDVSTRDLDRLVLDFAATEKQAEMALNSTLRKMATWLRGQSVRGLSQSLQIQQSVIRRRLKQFRLQKTPQGPQITVWYGLDPIALVYLKPVQTSTGVTAMGGRTVDGAFLATASNGKKQVFKRRGKERLPIEKQVADVQDKAETWIEDRKLGGAEFEAQFLKIFEHELKFRSAS